MTQHILAVTEQCIAMMFFTVRGNQVEVEGNTGLSDWTKKTMSKEEARVMYRELKKSGWIVPTNPPSLRTHKMAG